MIPVYIFFFFFFFNDPAPTEISPFPLHDALPISGDRRPRSLPSHAPGGPPVTPDVDALAREVVEGSPRALARALPGVESGGERAGALAARLEIGRAHA